jgi:poly(3-hydroxybutyrate) depolymerase
LINFIPAKGVFMLRYYGNSHLYTALEIQRATIAPVNAMAKFFKDLNNHQLNPMAQTEAGRKMAAGFELLERMTRNFVKPEFGIEEIEVAGKTYEIKEGYSEIKTFGRLIHFKKVGFRSKVLPKLLIVAPMSGHYATLLRGTVRDMLPFADVYITDWANAQDVPMQDGRFDLDDYVQYVIDFIHGIGEDLHLMAVCQPAVPVLAAVSLMSTENDPLVPKSMTLIGGPIDTRISPTEVSKLAEEKPIEWFEQTVVSRVPFNYPGRGRPVYPGFIQLSGFMTMNLERHVEAHKELFEHLVEGDGDSVDAHKKFYNEYLSVMDISAEFYLQTVEEVFQTHTLPKGEMMCGDKLVKPQDITKTAVLCIEGEKDDISGVGQTKSAITLCKNLPKTKSKYYMQKGAGHYGIFNGSKFRAQIVPLISDFLQKHA